jgi:hypothetical protein
MLTTGYLKNHLTCSSSILNGPRTTKKFTKLRPYKIKSYSMNHREQINTTSHIFLISETHFTSKPHLVIPGYNLCCTNHPDSTVDGGTAILIKSTIAYFEILPYDEAEIQATSIKVVTTTVKTPYGARD